MASVKCVQMVKYQIRPRKARRESSNHTVIHYSPNQRFCCEAVLNQFSLYSLQFVMQTSQSEKRIFQSETRRLMLWKIKLISN